MGRTINSAAQMKAFRLNVETSAEWRSGALSSETNKFYTWYRPPSKLLQLALLSHGKRDSYNHLSSEFYFAFSGHGSKQRAAVEY